MAKNNNGKKVAWISLGVSVLVVGASIVYCYGRVCEKNEAQDSEIVSIRQCCQRHDERIRGTETGVVELKTDVSYIRQSVDRIEEAIKNGN